MAQPTILILAAGLGSRYGSLKQLDKLGPSGETIIDYSVYDAKRAGFGKLIFVIRKSIENEFKQTLMQKLSKHIEVDYVLQELENIPVSAQMHPGRLKPWGTGHAVLMAKDLIKEPFAVINADDFYGADAFRVLYEHLVLAKEGQYAMVGYQLQNTLSDHGTVSRGVCFSDRNMNLVDITERTKIKQSGNLIIYQDAAGNEAMLSPATLVSMNCWGFTQDFFSHLEDGFKKFITGHAQTLNGEFYIPSVVNNLINESTATVKVLHSSAQWFGVTYPEDREHTVKQLEKLVVKGVYPEKLWENLA